MNMNSSRKVILQLGSVSLDFSAHFLLLILLFIAINHSCEYSYMQSRESSETTELGHLLVTS